MSFGSGTLTSVWILYCASHEKRCGYTSTSSSASPKAKTITEFNATERETSSTKGSLRGSGEEPITQRCPQKHAAANTALVHRGI